MLYTIGLWEHCEEANQMVLLDSGFPSVPRVFVPHFAESVCQVLKIVQHIIRIEEVFFEFLDHNEHEEVDNN